jgi:hypothetical protein
MADDDRGDAKVKVYEMSDQVRHFEIAYGGSGLARLYCEAFQQGERAQSTSRLHFDGDVRPDVMKQVIEAVTREVLDGLPRGVCVVYRGHLVSSFDYGATGERG